MDSSIEFDGGTEKNIEEILIWWSKFFNDNTKQALHATARPVTRGFDGIIPIAFYDGENETPMKAGDRIKYRGNGIFELVKA